MRLSWLCWWCGGCRGCDYGSENWIGLIIFAFFTYSSIVLTIRMLKGYSNLKADPTKEEAERIVSDIYRIDYSDYAEERAQVPYEHMLPPRPAHFKAFQIFSMIVSGICIALGLLYIILAIGIMFGANAAGAGALAGMYFLYGSLAAYFGIKDIISGSEGMTKSYRK